MSEDRNELEEKSEESESQLVVVVDREERETLSRFNWRWFSKVKDGLQPNEYEIETPMGDTRKVRGILISGKDSRINEHASEVVYLELTDVCNFACAKCGHIHLNYNPKSVKVCFCKEVS